MTPNTNITTNLRKVASPLYNHASGLILSGQVLLFLKNRATYVKFFCNFLLNFQLNSECVRMRWLVHVHISPVDPATLILLFRDLLEKKLILRFFKTYEFISEKEM